MSELADAPEALSTQLEPDAGQGASGGGAPRVAAEPEAKPEPKVSLRDTIAEAVKEEAKPDGDKPDAKPDAAKDEKAPAKGAEKDGEEAKAPEAKAPEAKNDGKAPERGADGKFAAKQAEGGTDAPEPKTDKPNGHIEPPAKFLPDAKETWRNTPRAVQRDVENAFREHEAEITRYREAAERYEPIRQYDDLVRQHGRAGVHETLQEVAELEDLMGKNPIAAINQILQRAGPRKADGSPVSLREFVQVVSQMDQNAYNQAVARQPQQQAPQNDNAQVRQLRADIARMQQEQLASAVIEPFRAANPRYDELKGDIAFFLQSGKIPPSLSPPDRLAAAYDMAVRINPASHAEAPAKADPDPGQRAVDPDLSGGKSIKSAPGAVSPDLEPERGGSTRDILRAELRRQSVR